jgi:hypothetical protein
MAFEIVSRLVSERYTEVQGLLTYIGNSERPVGSTEPETQIVHAFRGLFFVNLYGAWEYSITRALVQLYAAINSVNVEHRHLEHVVGSIALDSLFRSLSEAANRKQWEKRVNLLRRQVCAEAVEIDDNVFMADIQSLKFKVLERIFIALDINTDPVPQLSFRGLIDEVAERRSAVAHGRESPIEVGKNFRTDELRRRYDALSATSFHIIGVFEEIVSGKKFIRAGRRKHYSVS